MRYRQGILLRESEIRNQYDFEEGLKTLPVCISNSEWKTTDVLEFCVLMLDFVHKGSMTVTTSKLENWFKDIPHPFTLKCVSLECVLLISQIRPISKTDLALINVSNVVE